MVTEQKPLSKARFVIDMTWTNAVEQPVEGWTDGSHWNGWECPLFELAQGREVMGQWNKAYKDVAHPDGKQWARYDEERDAFVFEQLVDSLEIEADIFEAFERDGKRLYAIGSYAWVWELAS